MSSNPHPYGCAPDEIVTLAWCGSLTAREAVREIRAMPAPLRVPIMIFRSSDKTPDVLYPDQIEELAKSPGFL